MWIGSNTSIHAVPSGVQPDLVQVGVVAVARPDARDLPVGAVVDHVFALRRSRPARIRPCHQVSTGLPLVLLHLEVGRRRCSPAAGWNQTRLPVLVGDHRPRRALALVGREEQVAGRGARLGVRVDADRSTASAKARSCSAGLRSRVAGVDRELLLARRVLVRDREARRRRAACAGRRRSARETVTFSPGVNGLLGMKLSPVPVE